MKIKLQDIKALREKTGVGVMDARKALEESQGDIKKAGEWLKKNAVAKALKKADRATGDGAIFSYIHQTSKVAAMVKLGCETDFVAKSPDFQNLSHELCLQIAGFSDEAVPLADQPWIKDESKKIKELINDTIAKIGENISIKRYVRYSL